MAIVGALVGQRIADITREPEVLPPVPDPDLVVEVDEGEEKAKPRRRWWRALGPRLLVLVLFTGLAMAVFGNTWSDPTKLALGGGAGDGSIFIWFLRWSAYAIEHGENPFVTTWLNAPDGVSVLWNTSLVLPGVLLAPLTLALGPVFTFNLVNMAPSGCRPGAGTWPSCAGCRATGRPRRAGCCSGSPRRCTPRPTATCT
jgi:hypothetical protein